jgi:hypothetical protein
MVNRSLSICRQTSLFRMCGMTDSFIGSGPAGILEPNWERRDVMDKAVWHRFNEKKKIG